MNFDIVYPLGTETRLTESLSLIDAVTPDIVAARQNAHNAQKQAIKAEPGSGSEQNGVDVSFIKKEQKSFWFDLRRISDYHLSPEII